MIFSTPSAPLRVAVIGTSRFAELCHIPGIISHPQARVVMLCGRSLEKTRALADKFHIPHATDDISEVVSSRAVDAVTIASANADHYPQALAALQAGKHVLCEKPLAMNATQAATLADAAEAAGVVHQVAFTFRYNDGIRRLRELLLAGEIGRPFFSRIQYDRWEGLTADWRASWRENRDIAGAGLLFDLGSHLFDIQRHVLGPLQSVIGFTHTVARRVPHQDTGNLVQVETDDLVNAWMRHENGIKGQFFISRVTPPFAELGYLEVVGERGALKAALSRGTVDFLKRSTPERPDWEELPLPPGASDGTPHALGRMMRGFVDACLRGASRPDLDATFHDGLAAQMAMESLRKSEITQSWMPLAPNS